MNKAELIDALTGRLGDRKSANAALDSVLSEIQNAVSKGDKVSITGFGVFEKRVRAARTARNPRTGAAVRVARTSVPAFRPGTGFREQVAGGRLTRAAAKSAPPARKATKTATKAVKKTAIAAKKTTAKKTTAKKTAPARTAPARKTVTSTTARKAPARKAPASKAPASKATARKAPASKATARKAPARAATRASASRSRSGR